MKFNLKKTAAVLTGAMTLLSAAPMMPKSVLPQEIQAEAADKVIAFPGAVGGGKYATGGRGGEVVHVTNLNDSGAGSFRDAVSKPNRIVVFDVSGTIELAGNILVSNNVTIAGQTAPGGSGITLKNYKLGMSGDNIICRYISSRPGPYKATTSGNDAWGGAKGSNSIIDHCSMGYTTDEQWGLYSNNEYYTVQYSVLGPADSWGGHSKGIHGFGIMMGKGNLTFDHNLIAHNVSRNFRGKVVGTSTADFTNNVIYNWAYQTAYGTIGHLNYVNNTLKMGNGTTGGKHYVNVDSSTSPQNFKIYIGGNRMLNKDGSVYGTVTYDNWAGVVLKDGLGITMNDLKSSSAFPINSNGENVSTAMTCESSEASFENVVSFAGNGISPTQRTEIDQQLSYETRTGTGNLSGTAAYADADSTQKANLDKYHIQCGVTYKYPSAVLKKTITDADNDGMDDNWELKRGLDPSDPTDTNGDYCGKGYTNIEYYINDLTVNSFPKGVVTLSPESSTPVQKISAFEKIEAENFSEQSGVKAEDCAEGGQNVGYIENGDYIMFRNVNFETGAKSFTARVSSATTGGNIELYLDKISGTPLASCPVTGTGNWADWFDASFNIPTITETHNLYLRFTGGEGYLLNINHFVFGKNELPKNGKLIKNLYVKDTENGNDWSIVSGFEVGSTIFGDRDFTAVSVPESVIGAEIIRTACDSKNVNADLAEFEAAELLNVYVALDSRVENIPAWLADWTKTEDSIATSNDVTMNLYKKEIKAGTKVTLGTNNQAAYCINYFVLAMPYKDVQPTTTTTTTTVTTTATTTTTAPPEPEYAVGDINLDESVNISDLVMLQKYILQSGTLSDEQKMNADLNADGFIDSIDAALLRKILIQ